MRTAFCLASVLVLAAPAAMANTVGCGGNAFTFAEVVEPKPGTRAAGPMVSTPDSLCADLVEEPVQRADSLNISVGPPASMPAGRTGPALEGRPTSPDPRSTRQPRQ